MQAFFPGPLTLIVPKSPALPSVTTGGLDTVAIRMPDHRVARTFLLACGTPVAAPSANISGRPTSTTWEAVLDDLGGSIGCLLQDDTTKAGVESTVVDCTREKAVLLRPGVVTLEDLRSILPDIQVREPDSTTLARSPGMRYQHYAPKAHVQLVSRPSEAAPHARSAYIGLSPVRDPAAFGAARHCCTVEDYARTLFWFFRHCESMGIQRIYCQTTDTSGLGLALMDRLTRASPTVTASTATANQSGRTAR